MLHVITAIIVETNFTIVTILVFGMENVTRLRFWKSVYRVQRQLISIKTHVRDYSYKRKSLKGLFKIILVENYIN